MVKWISGNDLRPMASFYAAPNEPNPALSRGERAPHAKDAERSQSSSPFEALQ